MSRPTERPSAAPPPLPRPRPGSKATCHPALVVLVVVVFLVARCSLPLFAAGPGEPQDWTVKAPDQGIIGAAAGQARPASSRRSPRIPRQLILMGKEAKLAQMPRAVRANAKRMLAMSRGMKLRWFGDAACKAYLQRHFDAELGRIFAGEPRGSFRGDICRTAVLYREGGFYLDLDFELRVPLHEFADNTTTFVSAWTEDSAVLNAMLGATPQNGVMREALRHIRAWYRSEVPREDQFTSSQWMGPLVMLRGLRTVIYRHCRERRAGPGHQPLQWRCGPQVLRLYEEHGLRCELRGSRECPPNRAVAEFAGVRFGIFEPGPSRKLVAWPRFAGCTDWGCGFGGWDENPGAASQFELQMKLYDKLLHEA